MANALQQSLTEAMHFLSEQGEASSPAQAEELFRLSMQPLSEALGMMLSMSGQGIELSGMEEALLEDLIAIMQALAESVESDDDLVIPSTSVSTPAIGRVVSIETPGPFPIDEIENATN